MTEDYEGADQSDGTRVDADCTLDRQDQEHPLSPTHNLEVARTGGAILNWYICQYKAIGAVDEGYVQLGLFRVDDLPTGDGENIRFISISDETGGGSSLFNAVIHDDNGTVKWGIYTRDDGSFVLTLSTGALPLPNTDYKVKVYFKRHATEGVFTLYVDDVEVATRTTIISTRNADYVSWGYIYSDFDGPTSAFIDDVIIDEDDIVEEEGWDGGTFNGVDPATIGCINCVDRANIGTINGVGG